MAHVARLYNSGALALLQGNVDLENDTLKVLLVSPSYTFNADHDYVDDGGGVSPEDYELSGTNYTGGYAGSGRKTLGNKTLTKNDTYDWVEWHAGNLLWATLGADCGAVARAIIYKPNTDDTDSTMLACVTLDPAGTPDGTDFKIEWHATGVYTFSGQIGNFYLYNTALLELLKGNIDLVNDTLKIMLLDDAYVFDADHDFVDDGGGVSPEDAEISGTNYTGGFAGSGRKALANLALTKDDTYNQIKWGAANFTWTALGADCGGVAFGVIWKPNTDDTDSLVIGCAPVDPAATPDGNDFDWDWHDDGIGVFKDATG